jgi:membrane-associated protein
MELLAAVMTGVHALGPSWLDPENLLKTLGDIAFWVVVAIIFAECGLLIGFFLPGDSLLFVTGLFIATGAIDINIWLASGLLFIAAVAGNMVGYWIGAKAGPALFRKPESRIFKQEYVEKTNLFFAKHGGRAIILARFVPIVRTFITAVAGVARMNPRRFFVFTAVGGFIWAVGVTVAGYFLGNIQFVRDNVDLILILVVVVSLIPLILEFAKGRRRRTAD